MNLPSVGTKKALKRLLFFTTAKSTKQRQKFFVFIELFNCLWRMVHGVLFLLAGHDVRPESPPSSANQFMAYLAADKVRRFHRTLVATLNDFSRKKKGSGDTPG
ncbi:MAG: hypothetical protein EYX74_01915 [Desulfobulbaceae bacterium]|nr:MAG: hypothetical protein EYX74_01915 [Desulfobulbaceae bacterium]